MTVRPEVGISDDWREKKGHRRANEMSHRRWLMFKRKHQFSNVSAKKQPTLRWLANVFLWVKTSNKVQYLPHIFFFQEVLITMNILRNLKLTTQYLQRKSNTN